MMFRWRGPFQIREYLDNAVSRDATWQERWPQASGGVYLVSREGWSGEPTIACRPLYIGGNTGASQRFCTRVGDLVADMFGFFDGNTGHHSGGQKLWHWCNENQVRPADLFLGWASGDDSDWCARCAEVALFDMFPIVDSPRSAGLLNKIRPPRCRVHAP